MVTVSPQFSARTAGTSFRYDWRIMKPKRRKILLDRGDTLGGTVPLLLRDSVIARTGTGGRSRRKDRGQGRGWLWGMLFVILLLAAVIGWIAVPDLARDLGWPTLPELWARLKP